MTLQEARKVAEIASTADARCQKCVENLRKQLEEAFPEFVWTKEEYKDIEVQAKHPPERNSFWHDGS